MCTQGLTMIVIKIDVDKHRRCRGTRTVTRPRFKSNNKYFVGERKYGSRCIIIIIMIVIRTNSTSFSRVQLLLLYVRCVHDVHYLCDRTIILAEILLRFGNTRRRRGDRRETRKKKNRSIKLWTRMIHFRRHGREIRKQISKTYRPICVYPAHNKYTVSNECI